MEDGRVTELLGRAAAIEFAIGSIIRHMPDQARTAVERDLRLFLERSDVRHGSRKHLADAARSILKESGDEAV